jgi:hypothetical protein
MLEVDVLAERVEGNTSRVKSLLSVYRALAGRGQGRRPVNSADILRAGTVLLHATLEDFLRAVERGRVPLAPREVLARIPLTGTGARVERFTLGDLAAFRGETVTGVIERSVSEYLERQTYNNSADVVSALSRCNLDSGPVRAFLPQIAELIDRRHSIVHRADRQEKTGSGYHKAKSIGTGHLERWLAAVVPFVAAVLDQLRTSETALGRV